MGDDHSSATPRLLSYWATSALAVFYLLMAIHFMHFFELKEAGIRATEPPHILFGQLLAVTRHLWLRDFYTFTVSEAGREYYTLCVCVMLLVMNYVAMTRIHVLLAAFDITRMLLIGERVPNMLTYLLGAADSFEQHGHALAFFTFECIFMAFSQPFILLDSPYIHVDLIAIVRVVLVAGVNIALVSALHLYSSFQEQLEDGGHSTELWPMYTNWPWADSANILHRSLAGTKKKTPSVSGEDVEDVEDVDVPCRGALPSTITGFVRFSFEDYRRSPDAWHATLIYTQGFVVVFWAIVFLTSPSYWRLHAAILVVNYLILDATIRFRRLARRRMRKWQ